MKRPRGMSYVPLVLYEPSLRAAFSADCAAVGSVGAASLQAQRSRLAPVSVCPSRTCSDVAPNGIAKRPTDFGGRAATCPMTMTCEIRYLALAREYDQMAELLESQGQRD